ncbi:D-alanyl-D-alanine carboxypeptidase [Streptomyces sp. AmelKG-E11A]|nr:D-alanyl-D-alanine carboxypeptidase [Streptomyces sp. AmelKG-E11A]
MARAGVVPAGGARRDHATAVFRTSHEVSGTELGTAAPDSGAAASDPGPAAAGGGVRDGGGPDGSAGGTGARAEEGAESSPKGAVEAAGGSASSDARRDGVRGRTGGTEGLGGVPDEDDHSDGSIEDASPDTDSGSGTGSASAPDADRTEADMGASQADTGAAGAGGGGGAVGAGAGGAAHEDTRAPQEDTRSGDAVTDQIPVATEAAIAATEAVDADTNATDEATSDATVDADKAVGADARADEAATEADAVTGPEADTGSVTAEAVTDDTAGRTEGSQREPGDEPLGWPRDEPADATAAGATTDKAPREERDEAEDRDESADPDGERPAPDQATAVFRALPPHVDQPTTTLKLGDRDTRNPAPGADTDSPAGGGAGPGRAPGAPADAATSRTPASPPVEREQERTSKFVALKPLDEPSTPRRPTPKPSWAADAAAAPVPGARTAGPAETSALPTASPERTTQQPLPPRPPLDLLAELTNTPPPRETPLRTAARRVKIWTPLVLLLVIVFAVAQFLRPLPEPSLVLTAKSTYAFQGEDIALPWPEEGQGWMDVNGVGTMDEFGEQKPVPIGSVAKAMTAYVILKEHPLKPGADGASIPVDAKAEQEGGLDAEGESTLNTLKEGDKISQKDAIAAIMIPSANNIARLLARWDSSEKEFVEKMNQAAKDLGMKNTTYTDPSGLKETTVSSAEDQVKLGNALVRMKALTDITRLPVWTDQTGKEWHNYNRLVPYDNAIGIKTGSTTKAGGNLLFAATKEVGGETAIVVGAVLGQHKPPIIDTVNAVSKTAVIAAQDAVKASTVLKKGAVVGHVDDGLGIRTPVVVTKDVSAVGFAGHTVKLELTGDGGELAHQAAAGTRVGTLTVGDGKGGAIEVPVALQDAKSEPGLGTKLTRVG